MSQVWKGYLILRALLISSLFGVGASRALADEERDALISAHFLGTQQAYQSFLSQYPNSRFAPEVFGILAESFGKATKPAKPKVAKPAKTIAPSRPGRPAATQAQGAGRSAGVQY